MKKPTAEWVRKAEADLAVADRAFRLKPPITDPACIHCQQAVEKYLKALLCEHGLSVPKTHNLADLLNRLTPVDTTLARFRLKLDRLVRYAVDYRYPGIHASSRQAGLALKIATQVCDEVRQRLGLRNRRRPPQD
jgi:HEPN domain-containing protein